MITLIPAGNPGPFTGATGNNTWLVDGVEPTLVDAGVGDPAHLSMLESLLSGRPLRRIFLTHAHRDHAAGVPSLRARWPELEIVGGAALRGGNELRGPRISDGGWIQAGDVRMQVLATPGHSPDHACLWDPAARIIFAGDLLVSTGTVMIDATSGGGLGGYLTSLTRMRELQPLRVYPGHGPVIDDVLALIDQYISHRLERERQVLAALQAAPATIAALVQSIYPLLDPAVAPAAEETLLAHLRKLEDEGRVRQADGVWAPTTRV